MPDERLLTLFRREADERVRCPIRVDTSSRLTGRQFRAVLAIRPPIFYRAAPSKITPLSSLIFRGQRLRGICHGPRAPSAGVRIASLGVFLRSSGEDDCILFFRGYPEMDERLPEFAGPDASRGSNPSIK